MRRPKHYRDRYHGFKLNNTERDRVVANFIDQYPDDISELIKVFLYEQATGDTSQDQDFSLIFSRLDRILDLLRSGVTIQERETLVDEARRTISALDSFGT